MQHGSTKSFSCLDAAWLVVVRAVALLSAKPKTAKDCIQEFLLTNLDNIQNLTEPSDMRDLPLATDVSMSDVQFISANMFFAVFCSVDRRATARTPRQHGFFSRILRLVSWMLAVQNQCLRERDQCPRG